MMNLMKINNINAVIKYDPEIEMFRGEFVELNGGADFYAKDIESLNQWIVDTLEHAAHI
ncbi:MAG: hypothetical protein K8S13_13105 [Desulfobacula sp.]|uniref:hypothetical protein n=1 Tax=Desulfobacula sp. TaxID=2593537 RepID=UPI0025B99266|nr:hypothetical protein [Desulfobacula sp.]MCD4720776.1 hypothetical protein [Desulfobacula sp.]